ncbi:hypothetical protein [Rossellomorea marisflavi]|uniref:hypothetical protein n=1 Tax=Rossellomorea marisflavi TaxID=189381 RepID=UPI0015C4913D|nr:hypothetical protein [Rossellomorea marisflavi]UKS66772.1 hypothetical protein K6T23_08055 [Rossellomorea marisflavi]
MYFITGADINEEETGTNVPPLHVGAVLPDAFRKVGDSIQQVNGTILSQSIFEKS